MSLFFSRVQGVFSLLYIALNTIFWTSLLFLVTLFRVILPIPFWRKTCRKLSTLIAENWTFCNNVAISLSRRVRIEVEGLEKLDRKGWYIVISNHQSWVDIPILQKVFYRKIPMLKFFLKQELIKVPVLGLAWWALDFPFMKRYSKDYLKKHPHLKGKDVEITRKACRKFQDTPVSILNFVEGTRFSSSKHAKQRSPFAHLLKPKAGGIGFVIAAMGEQIDSILDVSIHYSDGPRKFWDFLCGRISYVTVKVDQYPLTDELRGNYVDNREYRAQFQNWLNTVWKRKDDYLKKLTDPETVPVDTQVKTAPKN